MSDERDIREDEGGARPGRMRRLANAGVVRWQNAKRRVASWRLAPDASERPSVMEGIAFREGEDVEDLRAHFEERAERRRRFQAESAALKDERLYPRRVMTKAEKAEREKASRPPVLFPTLRGYAAADLPHDMLVGVIVAALSLPISIGYAQVAGLPAEYGLYGGLAALLVYAAFSTSPRLVFGVDAAPAALTASAVVGAGFAAGSDDAVALIPWITLFTAAFLMLFRLVKAGRFVNYISAPVMGGFVSGIAISIIFGQIPKLMGGSPVGGEIFESVANIAATVGRGISGLSLALGVATIAIILTARRFLPKLPMPIIMLIAGGLATWAFDLGNHGVALLGAVPAGLPMLQIPSFPSMDALSSAVTGSFTIAVIVAAESLLVDNSFAMRGSYKIDDNREIAAFGLANFASFLLGSCPVSGSASRTAASEQFGGRTQTSSLVAAACLAAVLLFATDLLAYLPVPVLTAIVICALWSVVEVSFARRLFRAQRSEFWIFVIALGGVLVSGPIIGVVIGLALSFVAILLRTMNPHRAFLGVVPGRFGLFDLSRTPEAVPLPFTVIYRFNGNMFFANARTVPDDIEHAVTERTRVVVIELAGMNSCDITAADRLAALLRMLTQRGIRVYLVGMIGVVEDQLAAFGMEGLHDDGVLQGSVAEALGDAYRRGIVDSDGERAVRGEAAQFDESMR